MPSSWSASLRFELMFPGEQINVWGDKLDVVFQHVDYTIAGYLTKALSAASTALTIANAADDESRAAMIKFTGGVGPFTVVIPSVSKRYLIWNACTGPVTITTGAGATVVIDSGDKLTVFCDGSNVYEPGYAGLGLKAYIASIALSATGVLPAVTGNAGKYVYTDGASSYWKQVQTTDLGDYQANIVQAQINNAAGLAIVLGRRR